MKMASLNTENREALIYCKLFQWSENIMKENEMKNTNQNALANDEHVWEPEIAELEIRKQFAMRMGGEKGVERQHRQGKLTVRERIDRLLDKDSFIEVGMFTGNATYDENGKLIDVLPKNIIGGKGKINKRRVMVHADDFTIRGGSSETSSPEKMVYLDNYAVENQMPLIRLVDAAGGSIKILEQNQSTKLPGYWDWKAMEALSVIPVVAAALGPCAGLGAQKVALSHFSVMVKETSQVFAAGPQVVLPGMKESVSKEDLGGYKIHVYKSGLVNNFAESEEDAFNQIRKFLSYMPQSAYHIPPYESTNDLPDRREDMLASIVPREKKRVYDMRKIIRSVCDKDSLFEISKFFGRSQITMLGRINGFPVGILANDPYFYGGAMTVESAEKMSRFVDICDNFNIPIVNFVDQPGTLVGSQAEARGTVGKSVRALMAVNQVSVPWATVFIRRSFGLAGALYSPRQNTPVRFAWPSAYWGSIPIEGGVDAAFRKEIMAAENPEQYRNELIEYYKRFESPFRSAERFKIENIIDPRDTRPILCEWIEEAYEKVPQILGIKKRPFRV